MLYAALISQQQEGGSDAHLVGWQPSSTQGVNQPGLIPEASRRHVCQCAQYLRRESCIP